MHLLFFGYHLHARAGVNGGGLIHQQIHPTPANRLGHGLQSRHQLRSHRRRDLTGYPGFLAAVSCPFPEPTFQELDGQLRVAPGAFQGCRVTAGPMVALHRFLFVCLQEPKKG